MLIKLKTIYRDGGTVYKSGSEITVSDKVGKDMVASSRATKLKVNRKETGERSQKE